MAASVTPYELDPSSIALADRRSMPGPHNQWWFQILPEEDDGVIGAPAIASSCTARQQLSALPQVRPQHLLYLLLLICSAMASCSASACWSDGMKLYLELQEGNASSKTCLQHPATASCSASRP